MVWGTVLNQLKIVIVEDDAILCDLLKIRLAKMGYSVTGMYATGEDAIRAISDTPPDLVIMDVTLVGKMDGIETAQQIQRQFPLPVVYLTGSSDPQTFERAKITDDSEYVIKPFSDSDLHIAIEMAVHKYGSHMRTKKKQKFLENIIKLAGIGIITTDRDGKITIANTAAETLTGFHFHSSKKTDFFEMVHITNEQGQKIESPVDAIRSDMIVRDLPEQAILVTNQGDKIYVRGTVSPLKDEHNQFKGIIFTFSPVKRPNLLGFSHTE
jgi:PAS domain S-box-containing protein